MMTMLTMSAMARGIGLPTYQFHVNQGQSSSEYFKILKNLSKEEDIVDGDDDDDVDDDDDDNVAISGYHGHS